jgi:glycosyltransferase involved in cell wall biosynthesis
VPGGSISVLLPVFNGERFLAEAIDSVLAQSRRPSELIVVDDGSTDDSAAVARRYREVKLIQTENRGPAAARNTGVAEATGDLITFLDADDVMKPDRLERQEAALEEDPSASFVLGRSEVVVETAERPPSWRAEERMYHQMSLFTTRRVFELVGPFDEDLWLGDDTDWLFRAFEAGLRPALVPEPVILRRYPGRNITRDTQKVRAAQFQVMRRRVARRRASGSSGPSAASEALILGVPDVSSHDDVR